MKRLTFSPGLAVLGMAAATAVFLSGPAQASVTTSHTRTISGNEYMVGAVYGETVLAEILTFHLQWLGLVNQNSEFTLPAPGSGSATLPSAQGDLEVALSSDFTLKVLSINSSTCYVVTQASGNISVDGTDSTGLFNGASGNGSVAETLGALRPKNDDGTCDIFGNLTNPSGAFDVLTIKITPLTIAVPQDHN